MRVIIAIRVSLFSFDLFNFIMQIVSSGDQLLSECDCLIMSPSPKRLYVMRSYQLLDDLISLHFWIITLVSTLIHS